MSRWPEPLLIDVDTITLNGFFVDLDVLGVKLDILTLMKSRAGQPVLFRRREGDRRIKNGQ